VVQHTSYPNRHRNRIASQREHTHVSRAHRRCRLRLRPRGVYTSRVRLTSSGGGERGLHAALKRVQRGRTPHCWYIGHWLRLCHCCRRCRARVALSSPGLCRHLKRAHRSGLSVGPHGVGECVPSGNEEWSCQRQLVRCPRSGTSTGGVHPRSATRLKALPLSYLHCASLAPQTSLPAQSAIARSPPSLGANVPYASPSLVPPCLQPPSELCPPPPPPPKRHPASSKCHPGSS
jgi:hypothetical protein